MEPLIQIDEIHVEVTVETNVTVTTEINGKRKIPGSTIALAITAIAAVIYLHWTQTP